MKKRTVELQCVLTPKETRVLELLIHGRADNEIARAAGVSLGKLGNYRRRVAKKVFRRERYDGAFGAEGVGVARIERGGISVSDVRILMRAVVSIADALLTGPSKSLGRAGSGKAATAEANTRRLRALIRRLANAVSMPSLRKTRPLPVAKGSGALESRGTRSPTSINFGKRAAGESPPIDANDAVIDAVFQSTRSAIVVIDLAGHLVRASEIFARSIDYAADDLRGMALTDIAVGDCSDTLNRLLAGEPEVMAKRRYRAASGKLVWARERSTLGRDRAGVARYVVTRVDSFGDGDRDPVEGLSRREREVLGLVVSGYSSKEIAARLGVSSGSVDTYRRRIMLKLQIDGLPALVRFAIRHGVVST